MSTSLARKSTTPVASRTGGIRPAVSKRVPCTAKVPNTSFAESGTPLPSRPGTTWNCSVASLTRPPNRFCMTQSCALVPANHGHICLTCETAMSCTEKAAEIPGGPSAIILIEAVPSTSPGPVLTMIRSAESLFAPSSYEPAIRIDVVRAGSGEPSGASTDRVLTRS